MDSNCIRCTLYNALKWLMVYFIQCTKMVNGTLYSVQKWLMALYTVH